MKLSYAIKRIGVFFLIIWLAVTVNFALPRMMPGDPIEQRLALITAFDEYAATNIAEIGESYRKQYGLDKSVTKQYFTYWADLFRGDMGVSMSDFPQPVAQKISKAMPWTIGLITVATIISFVIGSLIGALLSWKRAVKFVLQLMPIFMILSAIPYFLLGLLLIFSFALVYTIFPLGGGIKIGMAPSWEWEAVKSIFQHGMLPALSIILSSAGMWGLGMRALMVTNQGEDFMHLAEAKGLPESRIFFVYAFRNAMLPQITAVAISLGFVLSGSVLVEVIFNYPGVGFLLRQAISGKDYWVIQGIVFILILSVGVTLLIVDLCLPLLDPRINYQKK